MATYAELKNTLSLFKPALLLESIVSHRVLKKWEKRFGTGFIFFIVIIIVAEFIQSIPEIQSILANFLPIIEKWLPAVKGITALLLVAWLKCFLLNAFYYSHAFEGIDCILGEHNSKSCELLPASFALSSVLYASPADDVTKGFGLSSYGAFILGRSGIGEREFRDFLDSAREKISLESISVDKSIGGLPAATSAAQAGRPIILADLAKVLFEKDTAFTEFFAARSIESREFFAAADWADRLFTEIAGHERFWARDRLGRIPGIGKDWAYGGTYTLEKYAHDIKNDPLWGAVDANAEFGADIVNSIEAVLCRSREANVILVGDPGSLKMEILVLLGKKIETGKILPPLEHKRIMIFDGNSFIESVKDKNTFERMLTHVLVEAIRAGNIILVIPDFPEFIESALKIGSDVSSLLDSYLNSPDLQVVATAETGIFHQLIEENTKLMSRFDKVKVSLDDPQAVLRILERQALGVEYENGIFFTVPALVALAESAERYFPNAAMPDKAIDLLAEIGPRMKAKKKTVVEREDVLSMIKEKTGIATGEVGGDEKAKLLNLEELLHQRIVGQDEAVTAIANAMRRARSGVGNPKRPMGSFLFLGPTGVGKTETTKALAAAFFGNENLTMRLDMSEYRTDDAIERLIGSFDGGKIGVLSEMLREHPYGVLLLDEFEKTEKKALDIFLQVLDEGFFSDMHGKRVNARNLIIIATSNAGSTLIWDLMKEGKNLAENKTMVVDEIVRYGIFKPELLNRFDGVILFHPLDDTALHSIARLMLLKLNKRLAEKGVALVITDPLLDYLVTIGADPKFGARPMNRAIQDKIEQAIADKMLKGEIRAGVKVTLTPEELK